MSVPRAVLLLSAAGMLGHGAILLIGVVRRSGPEILFWLAAVPLAQDLVLLPIIGLTGFLVARFAPHRLRVPAFALLAVAGTLVLLAVPLRLLG